MQNAAIVRNPNRIVQYSAVEKCSKGNMQTINSATPINGLYLMFFIADNKELFRTG